MKKYKNKTLMKAIKAIGTQRALAKACGVKPQVITRWLHTVTPPARVLTIEAATGISRHELRPDIYPQDAIN